MTERGASVPVEASYPALTRSARLNLSSSLKWPVEHPLTAREVEVLLDYSDPRLGGCLKETAMRQGMAYQTAKNHVTSILRKLGVETSVQAVRVAAERGYLCEDAAVIASAAEARDWMRRARLLIDEALP